MPNRGFTITVLAIATLVTGTAALATADARVAHKPPVAVPARN